MSPKRSTSVDGNATLSLGLSRAPPRGRVGRPYRRPGPVLAIIPDRLQQLPGQVLAYVLTMPVTNTNQKRCALIIGIAQGNLHATLRRNRRTKISEPDLGYTFLVSRRRWPRALRRNVLFRTPAASAVGSDKVTPPSRFCSCRSNSQFRP
jgi:hypothetical protein